MRFIMLAALTATAAAFSGMLPGRVRAEGAPAISGPFTHGNLAIYFIHGEERARSGAPHFAGSHGQGNGPGGRDRLGE